MEFKIDLKNIVKITTEKDGMFYEYEIKNGIITDVSVVNGENITSKRIDELIKKNNEVKKINKIIELDKNSKELTDALDDYSNYCEKRDKLEDEIWKKREI